MSDEKEDSFYIDPKTGIKVQVIPTKGAAMSLKTRKQGGGHGMFIMGKEHARKLKALAKLLKEEDKTAPN